MVGTKAYKDFLSAVNFTIGHNAADYCPRIDDIYKMAVPTAYLGNVGSSRRLERTFCPPLCAYAHRAYSELFTAYV